MKKILTVILVLFSIVSFGQLNIQLLSNLKYAGKSLANIGGYVDRTGREYALVGYTDGLDIVDVTNGLSPVVMFTSPGANSTWREVKVYRDYAYVTTEGGTGGLQIIDLSLLPAGISQVLWKGDSSIANQITTIHALHIDTAKAMCYLYGSNIGTGANNKGYPLMIDISKPLLPHYVGRFIIAAGDAYVHDGYVENDTAYFGHIYGGFVSIVDVRNKSNPVLLATQVTPDKFTHNIWLSGDHRTMFTTDEVTNSYLAAYDVSDLGNITELSRFQKGPGSNSIVHNTHILNDYAVTSWYTQGVVITDVSRPANPVEVGFYDTYPANNGGTFNGDWGVYPFLPSGNLLCSDINNGLFVLGPTYVRGCYLEGVVTDSLTGAPILNAGAQMLTTAISKTSDILGAYKMGTVAAGTYSVQYSKPGYVTKTVTGVVLANGVLTIVDVQLVRVSIQPKAYFAASVTGTCTGVVEFTDTSTNLPTSWNWDFGDGTVSGLQNPSHTYSASGTYTVTLSVANAYGSDSLKKTSLISVNLPPSPAASSVTICEGDAATLTASGSAVIAWYSSATGGSPLGTGSSFVTPLLTSTTSYYVESDVYPSVQHTGAVNDSIGAGAYFTTQGYHQLYFNTFAPITLVSVKVYAQGAGNRTITLIQNAVILQSLTVNIPNGTSRVTLNFPVPAGTNFELGVQGTTNLYRNSAGAVFPYTINGVVSITGTNAGNANYYYYFYDWIVQGPPCISPRVPVTASISSLTAAFTPGFTGLTGTFTDNSVGATDYAWNFGDPASGASDSSALQNPVHTFSAVGTYTVCLTVTGASGCMKTTCMPVTVTSVGINESTNQVHISYYPNPFKNSVKINFEGGASFTGGMFIVTDVAGRTVGRHEVKNHSSLIFGNELSSGIYFARLITGDGKTAVLKLIKSE